MLKGPQEQLGPLTNEILLSMLADFHYYMQSSVCFTMQLIMSDLFI